MCIVCSSVQRYLRHFGQMALSSTQLPNTFHTHWATCDVKRYENQRKLLHLERYFTLRILFHALSSNWSKNCRQIIFIRFVWQCLLGWILRRCLLGRKVSLTELIFFFNQLGNTCGFFDTYIHRNIRSVIWVHVLFVQCTLFGLKSSDFLQRNASKCLTLNEIFQELT